MKSKKTIIALTILLAVLALGIGYATISNVVLNISGSAAASADASNFSVVFDQTKTPVGSTTVSGANASGTFTDAKNATMSVSGLTTAGQSATVTYTVKNTSTDIKANLSATVNNTGANANYFTVSDPVFGETSINANDSTTVAITVTLNQTPINDVSANFSVALTATPAEQ